MIPLLVDVFIFVAQCADLWLSLTHPRISGWSAGAWARRGLLLSPKLLLASAAAGSFWLNVEHARPVLGARVVAALPPTALVVGFELLMLVARRAVAFRVARLQPTTAQWPS